MIERFKNDDSGFSSWVRDHHGGFALHRKTAKEFTIHVANCGHIYELGVSYRLTAAEKICSESEGELRRFAREHGGRAPTGCDGCGT